MPLGLQCARFRTLSHKAITSKSPAQLNPWKVVVVNRAAVSYGGAGGTVGGEGGAEGLLRPSIIGCRQSVPRSSGPSRAVERRPLTGVRPATARPAAAVEAAGPRLLACESSLRAHSKRRAEGTRPPAFCGSACKRKGRAMVNLWDRVDDSVCEHQNQRSTGAHSPVRPPTRAGQCTVSTRHRHTPHAAHPHPSTTRAERQLGRFPSPLGHVAVARLRVVAPVRAKLVGRTVHTNWRGVTRQDADRGRRRCRHAVVSRVGTTKTARASATTQSRTTSCSGTRTKRAAFTEARSTIARGVRGSLASGGRVAIVAYTRVGTRAGGNNPPFFLPEPRADLGRDERARAHGRRERFGG
jgi:hypothetical protein